MFVFGKYSRAAALGAAMAGGFAAFAGVAEAQSTAHLVAAKDATIRGGSYAAARYGRDTYLVTRKSDDTTYERRAVLTFDTETTVPARTTIRSAILVMTVRGGNSETRALNAFAVPVSFNQEDVTWRQRKTSTSWSHAGGDIHGSPVRATASPTPGSQVTFDVTQMVQRAVNGEYGSRYARFLVADAGSASRDSYREYHSAESRSASARPRLIVTYGGSTGTTSPSPAVLPNGAGDVILTAAAVTRTAGSWTVTRQNGALSGRVVKQSDRGASKVDDAASSPSNYFEMTFRAEAGRAYRLWVRGRAEEDSWDNDSVHVQFSDSVTSAGSATYRIGTSSSTEVNLEECSGCGLSGWMWEDNGWGARNRPGPSIYFAATGTQTIRVQTREDGLAIDQIVLSPATYRSTRPTLGTAAPAPAPAPQTPPVEEPDPAPQPSTSRTLKVLHWNIHHGVGQDGRYNLQRFVTWIARWRPDVISLNEVEKNTGWGSEDQPNRFRSLIQSATGQTWYVQFAQRYGNWSSSGQGNVILSRYPFAATGREALSYDRSLAIATIVVNGRNVTVMSTHLDADSHARRETQVREIQSLASGWSQPRVIAGDFNAWPDHQSYENMTSQYVDSWASAASTGTARSFSGNSPFGATRNGRIDYIFHGRGSTVLRLRSSHVPDTRDSSGRMPSDHRPILTTYEVR